QVAGSKHAYRLHDPRGARGRLLVSLFVGSLVALLLRPFGWPVRLVASWDATCVTHLTLAWLIISSANPAETGRRAAAEDPGRTAVWFLVVLSTAFSLNKTTLLIRHAKSV